MAGQQVVVECESLLCNDHLIVGLRYFRALFSCCSDYGNVFIQVSVVGNAKTHRDDSYLGKMPGSIVDLE